MRRPGFFHTIFICCWIHSNILHAQSAMINVDGRKTISLNGNWEVIMDPADAGESRRVWEEKKPQKKTDFVEYSFEGGPLLKVPADFNSQMPELTYTEGTIWYKKTFQHAASRNKRLFLHFGSVNYLADIYLNGKKIGSHEGGFTPFQFELTKEVREGENSVVVKVDNRRQKDGLPGNAYDWFNYGGITRDVNLIETGETFIEDYFIQLKKHQPKEVTGWIQLNGVKAPQHIRVLIPELKIDYHTNSDAAGRAVVNFPASFQWWSPQHPKLYSVIIQSEDDTVQDQIGFRTLEVNGTKILLNGKSIFLKGVNIHEERPLKGGRSDSEEDARTLLGWAKDLGCNLVRLAHYPHNEQMVKLAEKMGIMVWDEIPAYQHVEFASAGFVPKMNLLMNEMMRRDRNRCGVIIWSLSNETYSTTPDRDKVLIEMARRCRLQDSTRLITSVFSNERYENQTFHIWDSLNRYFDVMCMNEYLGWYQPWQGKPAETKWDFVCQKPLIISEFGGEAKYGSNAGPNDEAASWSEAYQEQIYRDQTEMFKTTPNLAGLCAWILIDYRSPVRMQPVYQNGYNRKGLLSEKGEKKKAWYVLKQFYETKE